MVSPTSIYHLPRDMCCHILSLTDPSDIIPMCSVNKEWNQILSKENFKRTTNNITSLSRLYERIEEFINSVGYGESKLFHIKNHYKSYALIDVEIKPYFEFTSTRKIPYVFRYLGSPNDEFNKYSNPTIESFNKKNVKLQLCATGNIDFKKIQNILEKRVKKLEEDNLYSNIKIASIVAPTLLALGALPLHALGMFIFG